MFTVSFRVYMNTVAGAAIYVNGSAGSLERLPKGTKIVVRYCSESLPDDAEVIESVPTKRTINEYAWEII